MKRVIILFSLCFLIFGCEVPKTFEEIGFWKDRGNRVYTVFTSHTDWELIKSYAREKPWKRGRLTMVYFFYDRDKTPDISTYKEGYDIPKRYKPYLLAVYKRLGKGNEKLIKSSPI